jgi:hypothetical protein
LSAVNLKRDRRARHQMIGGGNRGTVLGTVPEPSAWAMIAIGFAGLGFLGVRGRRKAATA